MQSLLALTDTQISTWVASFILPLFRVTAVLMSMPVFGTTLVPRRIRLYFAVAITVVLVPGLPPMPAVNALDLSALMLIAEQILIGSLLGFSLQLFFQAFVIAGQIISIQMGMGFASMVLATFTPPPLPRPPAWIWALTTHTGPPSFCAASTASCTVKAGMPRGTGTPN